MISRAAWCLVLICLIPIAACAEDAADPPEIHSSEHNLGISSFVCTATNDLGNQQCSVTCRAKELADCEDAEGAGTPTCRCQDQ